MIFLKNLFSSSKPTIDSVRIDSTAWTQQEKTSSKCMWETDDYPAVLTLNFFNIPPDLPCLPSNIEVLRPFYRKLLTQNKGGLIEVSTLLVENVPGVKTIFKFPLEPKGMSYLGSITLPFKNCSYVVKMQAYEEGITGMREAVIGEKMTREGKIISMEEGAERWSIDPYDPEIKEGTLMNLSEKEEYDFIFPEHPLTFIRNKLKALQESIQLREELLKIEKFI
jgi:hypothetical protein